MITKMKRSRCCDDICLVRRELQPSRTRNRFTIFNIVRRYNRGDFWRKGMCDTVTVSIWMTDFTAILLSLKCNLSSRRNILQYIKNIIFVITIATGRDTVDRNDGVTQLYGTNHSCGTIVTDHFLDAPSFWINLQPNRTRIECDRIRCGHGERSCRSEGWSVGTLGQVEGNCHHVLFIFFRNRGCSREMT